MSNKKKMTIISIAAGVILVTIALILILCLKGKNQETEESYRTIKIFDYTGEVVVTRNNTDINVNTKGMNLKSGDALKTLSASTVALKLDDDKYIYIDENSIVKLYATGTKNNTKTSFYLEQGSIIGDIQNRLGEDETFDIYSSNTIMSIHGTSFGISKSVSDTETTISVKLYRGEASVHMIEEKEDGTFESNKVEQSKDEVINIVLNNDKTITEEQMDAFIEEINTELEKLEVVEVENIEEIITKSEVLTVSVEETTVEEKEEVATIFATIKEKEIEEAKEQEEQKDEQTEKKESIFIVNSYFGYYDGTSHQLDVTYNGDGLVEYSLDDKEYTKENFGFTDAGYYIVYVRLTEGDEVKYSYGSIEIVSLTILDQDYKLSIPYQENLKTSDVTLPTYEGMSVKWDNPSQTLALGENKVAYTVTKDNFQTLNAFATITLTLGNQIDSAYTYEIKYRDGLTVADIPLPVYEGAAIAWDNALEKLVLGENKVAYTVIKQNYNDLHAIASIKVTKGTLEEVPYTLSITYSDELTLKEIALPTYEGSVVTWVDPTIKLIVGENKVTYLVQNENYEDLTGTALITVNKGKIIDQNIKMSLVYITGFEIGNVKVPTYEGCSVTWDNPHELLTVGENRIAYTVTKENYEPLKAIALITITKGNIEEKPYTTSITYQDGLTVKEISLPVYEGYTVKWNDEKQALVVGENKTSYTVSLEGYNDLIAEATITVSKGIIEDINYKLNVIYQDALTINDLALPAYRGFTVVWNNPTEKLVVGEYECSYTVSKDNYESLVSVAKVQVNKATITDIHYSLTLDYVDNLSLSNITLPIYEGFSVSWLSTDINLTIGENRLSYQVEKDNYETLEAIATITINKGKMTDIHYEITVEYKENYQVQELMLPSYPNGVVTWDNESTVLKAGDNEIPYTVTMTNYEDLKAKAIVHVKKANLVEESYSKTVDYVDGLKVKDIDLPIYEGCTVTWVQPEEELVVGNNTIDYTVTKEGYNDLQAKATITVNLGTIEDIHYETSIVYTTGINVSLVDLPQYDGCLVSWTDTGKALELGENEVTYLVAKQNYKDLIAKAKITVTEGKITDIHYEATVEYCYDYPVSELALPEYGLTYEVEWTNPEQQLVVGLNRIAYTVSKDNYETLNAIALITVTKGTISGYDFTLTVDYTDGLKVKELTLPEYDSQFEVSYDTPEVSLTPGTYQLDYTVKCEGYNDLHEKASVTVNVGSITDINYTATITYTLGLTVSSIPLPVYGDLNVYWENDMQELVIGENELAYTVSGDYYNDLTATAKITINKGTLTDVHYSVTINYIDGLTLNDVSLPVYGDLSVSWVLPGMELTPGSYTENYIVTSDYFEAFSATAAITVNQGVINDIEYAREEEYSYDYPVSELYLPDYGETFNVVWDNPEQQLEVGVQRIPYTVSKENYETLKTVAIITVKEGVIYDIEYTLTLDYIDGLKVKELDLPNYDRHFTVSYDTPEVSLTPGTYQLDYTVTCEHYKELHAKATITVNEAKIADINYTATISYTLGLTIETLPTPVYEGCEVSWITTPMIDKEVDKPATDKELEGFDIELVIGENVLYYRVQKQYYEDLIAQATITINKGTITDINYTATINYVDGLTLADVSLPLYNGFEVSWADSSKELTPGTYEENYTVTHDYFNMLNAKAIIIVNEGVITDIQHQDTVEYCYDYPVSELALPDYGEDYLIEWTNPEQQLVVGVQRIAYTVSKENYATLRTVALITVTKGTICGYDFELTVNYTDDLKVEDLDLPEYEEIFEVSYDNPNESLIPGTYQIAYTVKCDGYNDLHEQATITVNNGIISDINYTATIAYTLGLSINTLPTPVYEGCEVSWITTPMIDKEVDKPVTDKELEGFDIELVIGENVLYYRVQKQYYEDLIAQAVITINKGTLTDVHYSVTINYMDGLTLNDVSLPVYGDLAVSWVLPGKELTPGSYTENYIVTSDYFEAFSATAAIIVNEGVITDIHHQDTVEYCYDYPVSELALPDYGEDYLVEWTNPEQQLVVGEQRIAYTVSKDNYATLSTYALITVTKGTICGYDFELIVNYTDGLKVEDLDLPEYEEIFEVSYDNPDESLIPGTYQIAYTVKCDGYNDLHEQATITVNNGIISNINYTATIAYTLGLTIETLPTPVYEGCEVSWITTPMIDKEEGFDGMSETGEIGDFEIELVLGENVLYYMVQKQYYDDLMAYATITITQGTLTDPHITMTTNYHDELYLVELWPEEFGNYNFSWDNPKTVFESIGTYQASYTVSSDFFTNELQANATIIVEKGTIYDNNLTITVPYSSGLKVGDLPLPEYVFDDYNFNWVNSEQILTLGTFELGYTLTNNNYNTFSGFAVVTVEENTIEEPFNWIELLYQEGLKVSDITLPEFASDLTVTWDNPNEVLILGDNTLTYTVSGYGYKTLNGHYYVTLYRPYITYDVACGPYLENNSNNYSIIVTCEVDDCTITYSTDGTNYSVTNPSYASAGTYKVYFKIEKEGYETVEDSVDLVIKKPTISITVPDGVSVRYNGNVITTDASYEVTMGQGITVELVSYDQTNYTFNGWIVNGEIYNTNITTSITVTGDMTISLSFTEN